MFFDIRIQLLILAMLWFFLTRSQAQETPVFINEIHYDNVSGDIDEGVEIAGPAGTVLDGWQIIYYNGSNGSSYGSLTLSGVLPDAGSGTGFLFFPTPGLQNGPDALALVDSADSVWQFISYEGSFAATDGPASGLISQDMTVAEGTNTPVGFSLQLAGSGRFYQDFAWAAPDSATFGAQNRAQFFMPAAPDTLPTADGGIGAIGGAVLRDSIFALPGITIILLDSTGSAPFDSTVSGPEGLFLLDSLPAGDYWLKVAEPLGLSAAENPVRVAVLADTTRDISIYLDTQTGNGRARSATWWMRQFRYQHCGDSTLTTFSPEELATFSEAVQQHYDPHYPFFRGVASPEAWYTVLRLDGHPLLRHQARRQVAALLLNLISGKLSQFQVISRDGRQIRDVLDYTSQLLQTDHFASLLKAWHLALKVNLGKTIRSGVIPASNISFELGENPEVKELATAQPQTFRLYPNFPNPFNPGTTIRFDLARPGTVRLTVFNVLGQEVARLADGSMAAGPHRFYWDSGNLPSGVYLYRLEAGGQSRMHKMFLVR